MTEAEELPERDERTFPERVERVNLAWLVSVSPAMVERLAQLVDDDLNEVGGRLVYHKVSSDKLFIIPARDLEELEGRSARRDDAPRERRRYSFGT
jgi:hypothetical protein